MNSSASNSRRRSSGRALALCIAAIVCAGALPARAAECPASEVEFTPYIAPTYSAVFDTVAGTRHAAFDLPHAWILVHHPGALGGTFVRARDSYDVVGVAAGTHVQVFVKLDASGTISTDGCGGAGCWGSLRGRLSDGVHSAEQTATATIFAAQTVPVDVSVELPLELVAGQPTWLEVELMGYRAPGGSHVVDGSGTWRFTNVPPGAVVVSCQGYVDPSTPASPFSWGRLKAAYR
jgi:hypothetical protein